MKAVTIILTVVMYIACVCLVWSGLMKVLELLIGKEFWNAGFPFLILAWYIVNKSFHRLFGVKMI